MASAHYDPETQLVVVQINGSFVVDKGFETASVSEGLSLEDARAFIQELTDVADETFQAKQVAPEGPPEPSS